MNAKDFADCIRLMRRAPLQSMDEAEAVAALLQRFSAHAEEFLKPCDEDEPDITESPGGTA